MDHRTDVPAAQVIWDHDNELMQTGLGFYRRLEARLAGAAGRMSWTDLSKVLAQATPPGRLDQPTWERVRASHTGFQCGLELLDLLPLIGERTGFFELRVEEDLSITIPPRLTEPALQARMKKVLAPPPATRANEIVAATGGMFYAQEAPHLPPFVKAGSHFEAGDPLYIVEVMKMFNKIHASFAGTIDKILIESGEGSIVRKGQPLFSVTPDERMVDESPADRQKRQRDATRTYLGSILR
jgi:biotin carboxyl carrier protein